MGGSTIQRDGIIGFSGNTQTGVGLTSNFDIERIEIINGPQSLLYATGGAGGVLVNLISKQARLGAPAFGALSYQVDQYGNKLGQFDYGVGTNTVAIRLAVIDQSIGGRRVNIGGPASGYYAQLALKLFGNTVIRVNSEESTFTRMLPDNLALTAASTSNDARNGQFLNWLIATNQVNASATGASGAGSDRQRQPQLGQCRVASAASSSAKRRSANSANSARKRSGPRGCRPGPRWPTGYTSRRLREQHPHLLRPGTTPPIPSEFGRSETSSPILISTPTSRRAREPIA